MELREYFENTEGLGVLSTADRAGRVDAALYARPHVMEDGLLAFIMANKATHKNLQENPSALYLFRENGSAYRGKRLSLTKVREEADSDVLQSMRRRSYSSEQERAMKPLRLVYFEVDAERPLVGDA